MQVGWMLPIFWLVAVFLPFCTKNRKDRHAAISSGVMLAIYVVAFVMCAVVASKARN